LFYPKYSIPFWGPGVSAEVILRWAIGCYIIGVFSKFAESIKTNLQ